MLDYHIHTGHSIDAEGSLKDYCEKAIKLGLKEICITNHCELDPNRNDNFIKFLGQNQPLTQENLLRLQNDVVAAKEIYKKFGLLVRFGLEIGYYDGIETRLKVIIAGLEFDFLLAGIHCLNHICIDSSKEHEQYFTKRNADELVSDYYQAIEKLLNCHLFDSLAHLDVYKKYGLKFYGTNIKKIPRESLSLIFRSMAKNELALEINTAGFRRVGEFYPSEEIMKLAKANGIKLITIGSDCHKVEDLGSSIKQAIEYTKSFGFEAIYGFEKRKPVRIKI